ncbi:uncharacterized protein DUF1684 [Neolewinella xylanilytica]|uniref:Uncharacterized protein DUF1684 n=1 Tax=Neolewinella xylanilytica TaxID=1514080 RepID=A0A2S6IA65_9BACT|nr:DUF1684 domain-containing protein [Neolewinella xylanilytica]PPK88372.1 uncharacterized protein DUF1684 [Neolewinella xylanilytica]
MHHSLRSFFGTCLLLLTPFIARSQADVESDPLADLIDRLYTAEGFQQRFVRALEANAVFRENDADEAFIEAVMPLVRETALLRYGMAVRQALADFSPGEIATLQETMESSAGPVLAKVLAADQTSVQSQLRTYVAELVATGLAAKGAKDSLLYHRDFGYDLRELMDGEYLQPTGPGTATLVRREGNVQTEYVGAVPLRYDVEWRSNSRYRLTPRGDNPLPTAGERTVNVYEIEGNEFRYIYPNPDGTYTKDRFFKTAYTSYEQEMKTFRVALDEQYRHPGTSPLPEAERETFAGHDFFPVDEAYRVVADFVPDTTGAELTMLTSSGSSVTYTVYGRAQFDLGGGAQELMLLHDARTDDTPTGRLFVPFRDATSGKSTYGGGRYLDIPFPQDGTLVLDFNKAYNPYCAYTVGYACPVPPEENTLGVAVEVGVKAPPAY